MPDGADALGGDQEGALIDVEEDCLEELIGGQGRVGVGG